jgi:hypothetical protein
MRALVVGLVALFGWVMFILFIPATAQGEKPRVAGDETWFVPDDDWLERFTEKAGRLARKKQGFLPAPKITEKMAVDQTTEMELPRAASERLEPEELYRRILPSVFVIGTAVPTDDPEEPWGLGRMATAWVARPDGVLVTNWHLFEDLEKDEVFAAMDSNGAVYPLTEVLAVDRRADIAVVRIQATGLKPLSLARQPAPVGAAISILGHPGDCYYTFTQGNVTRYSLTSIDEGEPIKWMGVSADYAAGSSGSPVVDRAGNVVGMAAQTVALDYPLEELPGVEMAPGKPARQNHLRPIPVLRQQRPPDVAKPGPLPPAPAPAPGMIPGDEGSRLQMVVKLAVPLTELQRVFASR